MSLVGHAWWEFAAVFTAVTLAWLGLIIKTAQAHIDRRIDTKLGDQVAAAVKAEIRNGVTERMDRIEDKIDELVTLHLTWRGKDRNAS